MASAAPGRPPQAAQGMLTVRRASPTPSEEAESDLSSPPAAVTAHTLFPSGRQRYPAGLLAAWIRIELYCTTPRQPDGGHGAGRIRDAIRPSPRRANERVRALSSLAHAIELESAGRNGGTGKVAASSH